jgi:hypothetical protein
MKKIDILVFMMFLRVVIMSFVWKVLGDWSSVKIVSEVLLDVTKH